MPITDLAVSKKRHLHRVSGRVSKAVLYLVLIVLGVLMIFPFVWLIRSSLMTDRQIFAMPLVWIPNPVSWKNIPAALTAIPYLTYFFNTVFLVAVNMIGTILSCSFSAFGFSRISFRGRGIWFVLLLLTLMLPATVLLIPQFIGWKIVGAYNTYLPLTVTSFFGNAFYIFLLRQFYSTIPLSYDEAAFIDGANYLHIYWKIIMPLSKTALTAIGVFTFMYTWNDFMGPLIYLSDSNKWTISMGLNAFLGQYHQEWELLMAAATVTIIPMIIVFFFCQRAFIEGITLTGVKG